MDPFDDTVEHPGHAPPLPAGTRFARYEIVELLGRGGMGEVYLALDPVLQRKVAIKRVRFRPDSDSAAARQRLLREARALASLSHDNVLVVHDAGEVEQEVFIAMELVDGQTLDAWLRIARRPRAVLDVMLAAGRGLAAAHAAGIVHRDFKPANVLIARDGRVRVADFGLARAVGEPVAAEAAAAAGPLASMTQTGAVVGTPLFMSPEQHAGRPADQRSDQFSFGVAVYVALYGRHPFAIGDSKIPETLALAVAARQGRFQPPPPRRGVSARARAALARSLAPDPASRHPSMDVLLEELAARPRMWVAPALGLGAALAAAGAVIVLARPDAAVAPVRVGASRPLTELGGCAYAPVFADAHTVVFDHTAHDRTDLFAIDVRAGAPRRLTDTPGMEWRAARGRREGEVLFVDTDDARAGLDSTRLATLDLKTGARGLLSQTSPSASFGGGWLYYQKIDGSELRRARGTEDESVVTVPGDLEADSLTASPDGRWLSVHASYRSPVVCLVEVGARRLDCLKAPGTVIGRGDFAPSSRALYYGREEGIHRVELATRDDRLAVGGALAFGGLAVAPDRKHVVYSTCRPRGNLLDISQSPPRAVTTERPREVTSGRGGRIAYVRVAPVRGLLVVREADGTTRVLTAESLGVAQQPSFDDSGERLAFAVRGPNPGIWIADAAGKWTPTQLTRSDSDTSPIWVGAGELLFTRGNEQRQPAVYAVSANGGEARRVHPAARQTEGVLHKTGEVLLTSPDSHTIYLWDRATGREREVVIPALHDVYYQRVVLSFDGSFLAAQTGGFGQEVWRVPLAAPERSEKVFDLEQGQTMDALTVDESGHILVAPQQWLGELVLVEGRFD